MAESTHGTRTALAPFEPMVRFLGRRHLASARATRVLDLDDLLVEGRLAVLDAIRSHNPARGSVRTWASRIAQQRMRDAIRRHTPGSRSERGPLRPVSLEFEVPDSHHLPDVLLEHADKRAWLLEAIAELRPRLRVVVALRLQGVSLAEIGARLGVGETRATQLQREAVATLRRARRLFAAEARHA